MSGLALDSGRKIYPEEKTIVAAAEAVYLLFCPVSGSRTGHFTLTYRREATPVIMTPWKSLADSSYKHKTQER